MLLAGIGIGAVGAAAAAAPVPGLRLAGDSGRPASWWDRNFLSLQNAGMAEWSGAIGETFTLNSPNGSHMLRIVAVTAFPKSGSRPTALGRSQAFSVVFELIAGAALPPTDRLYQIAHQSYPPLSIYMGAPSLFGRATRLSAVFN